MSHESVKLGSRVHVLSVVHMVYSWGDQRGCATLEIWLDPSGPQTNIAIWYEDCNFNSMGFIVFLEFECSYMVILSNINFIMEMSFYNVFIMLLVWLFSEYQFPGSLVLTNLESVSHPTSDFLV